MADTVNINWDYSGPPNALTGTGSTRSERLLTYGFAVLATVGLVGFLRLQEHPATYGWRLWLLIFFASDILGGAVANMLNSCKRMYHAPQQRGETGFRKLIKNPIAFTLLHIHPIAFAWAFFGDPWLGAAWYIAAVASVALTLATPLFLRRPIATALYVTALLISLYGPPLAPGMEWFIPCLFLKLVLGHAVREEPYRPSNSSA